MICQMKGKANLCWMGGTPFSFSQTYLIHIQGLLEPLLPRCSQLLQSLPAFFDIVDALSDLRCAKMILFDEVFANLAVFHQLGMTTR